MSNSLSNINISSELAKTKVDTDRQRTKEYIGQISDTSNRMVQAMYDMVWSIDPKNDTMFDTIERMKSFAIETEGLHDIDILFDIDEAAAVGNGVTELLGVMERGRHCACTTRAEAGCGGTY